MVAEVLACVKGMIVPAENTQWVLFPPSDQGMLCHGDDGANQQGPVKAARDSRNNQSSNYYFISITEYLKGSSSANLRTDRHVQSRIQLGPKEILPSFLVFSAEQRRWKIREQCYSGEAAELL